MNFAGIGVVIGHELTHGFDNMGRHLNWKGQLAEWWDKSTEEKYKEKAQCFVEQAEKYTIKQVNVTLNGILKQRELIADTGGIREAYLGYVNYEKTHPQQKLPGHKFTSRQMFWIGYGQVMCAKYKDGFLKHLLKTSEHPSGEFRINGPLSNNPDFANDFKCPTGSPMNPADKCKLW